MFFLVFIYANLLIKGFQKATLEKLEEFPREIISDVVEAKMAPSEENLTAQAVSVEGTSCQEEMNYIKSPCEKGSNLCFIKKTCGPQIAITVFCPATVCLKTENPTKIFSACSADTTYTLTNTKKEPTQRKSSGKQVERY